MVKTHLEGGVESMGNYIEMHSDKRMGRIDVSGIEREALIHLNGRPLAKADKLGKASLHRVFGGTGDTLQGDPCLLFFY